MDKTGLPTAYESMARAMSKLEADNAELRERAERAEGERDALSKMSGARESLSVWRDLQEQCREVSKANRVIGDLQAELTAARSDLAALRERMRGVEAAAKEKRKCSVCDGESELFEMTPVKTMAGRWIHRLKEGFSRSDNPTYFRCRLRAALAPALAGEGETK